MTSIEAATTDSTPPVAGAAAADAVRTVIAAIVGGALSGFVIGGLLGRLAMRLMAATSPEIAQGRLTDDAARVGQITLTGSMALAVALSVGGAFVGLAYLVVRRGLQPSRRARIAGFALFCAMFGGASFVHDHPSFDYTILQPAWLAVALFIAIPGLAGAAIAGAVETACPPPRARFTGPVARLWRSRPVSIVAIGLYWAVVALGAYGIVADVVSLTQDRPSTAPLTW